MEICVKYKEEVKTSVLRIGSDNIYRGISIVSPFLVILLWEILTRTGVLDARFFPAPSQVIVVLAELVKTGELSNNLFISLQRIVLGFFLGAIPGVILGMLMGWSRMVRAFLDPIISALYPVPKVSLLPLILIIFGIGETSKVVVVAIAGFFIVLITTAAGVMHIDPVLIQAAQNYGAKGWKLFSKVILPASLPAIFTGLRLSLGICLLIIVAAEFVAANRGIGYLIWISWSTLSVGKMYAGLVVVSVMGLLFTTGLEKLGKVIMPWAQESQDRGGK
jgi:ABC-type nitrate/sulfonate/bicarbonate transport system permease component